MSLWLRLLPVAVIGVGLVTFALSAVPDGGFVRGMFQGAGGALVVLGLYLAVQSFRPGGRTVASEGMWRPSADRHE
ncbi:hypothetical protein GA707_16415 [Nostocoides sp. F2B08]|uniref:hypothetical protein n=1 Tax=Nostocoides sp. F2B08 TaxID=2653936 RepID=UPI0012638E3F|nr:hypothetical protein [Tetrasphaera sp. F2B08]KAB7742479.1 hypothetical protein GA707_16415 [Tetrasphaera sp. F2B08]